MATESLSGPDPTLYLYTSLTAGSSHIITATSRLETILKANKIAFRAIDCATDEKARSLWSRRSKGRKIPGLVKFGQVIGDLEEVEEWNEYGEIKDNIDSVDNLFGDTPMTDTPMPPPAPITTKDPLAKVSEPPSRSSSATRHISISDPKDKDGSGSPTPSVKNVKDDTPLSVAMRQAGAEAAAKAGQRKASAASSLKSTSTGSVIPSKRDSTETTPTPAAIQMSVDAEEPAEDPDITSAKTPAQLAAEGAKRTSVDKIMGQTGSDTLIPSTLAPDSKSNEEQLLEARRTSSITKVPSRLHEETSVDDVKTPVAEQAPVTETDLPQSTTSTTGSAAPRLHRGSSISEASKEEIKAIEARNAIKEESEEDSDNSDNDDDKVSTSATKSTVQATDTAEAEVMKGTKPQDHKAKDASAAGVSVAAAMFLSPNHDPNPNRLSADSASVYSFFDSAFSPAPLFSGAQNLDLNLNFMQDLSVKDPRTSISTYGTNDIDEVNGIASLTNGSTNEHTPKTSQDMERQEPEQEPEQKHDHDEQEGSPRREILPIIPTVAPLRTPAKRQVSEPLLSSTANRFSTPTSVPLPLNIRKSPTVPSTQSPNQSPSKSPQTLRSQPHLLTELQTAQPSTQTQTPSKSQNHQATSPLSPQPTDLNTNSNSSIITSPISPVSATPSTPLTPSSTINLPTPTSGTPTESRALRFKKSIRSLRSKKSTQALNNPSPTKEMPPNLPPQRQLRDIQRTVSDTHVAAGPKKSGMKNLLCF